jgi:integrase/recombinase XerD
MLETYFKYPGVLRRMRSGPLVNDIDDIATQLTQSGYSRHTTIRYLSLVASFSRYARKVGCAKPDAMDRALGERFVTSISTSPGTRSLARTAVLLVLRHVVQVYSCGSSSTAIESPDCQVLTQYDAYLHQVRGLQLRSREGLLRRARCMLEWYRKRRHDRPLSDLRGADVLDFVSSVTAEAGAYATRSAAVSELRGFLRYLQWQGVIQQDLASVVPRVPCWRLAQIPSYLDWTQIRGAIDAIDGSSPVGKRDRALLLLLATTGLRSGELRRLEVRDVRWRKGEIYLRRTKSCRARVLPLLDEAGRALADYVLHGRPQVAHSVIFLSHRPPVRPLKHSSTMAAIVRRRLADCGIRPARAGAHLVRHSLATRMVQQRRPIKEVADLLGHRSIDTTAVYVKVALPQLASVALPFPEGAK